MTRPVASAAATYVHRVMPLGVGPTLLAFAADSGAFAALRGEDVGVAGVGVAPAQVVLQLAGQDAWLGWFEAPS